MANGYHNVENIFVENVKINESTMIHFLSFSGEPDKIVNLKQNLETDGISLNLQLFEYSETSTSFVS